MLITNLIRGSASNLMDYIKTTFEFKIKRLSKHAVIAKNILGLRATAKLSTMLLPILIATNIFAQGQPVSIISGKIINPISDTLKCVLKINSITLETRTITIIAKNGEFKEALPIAKPTFFYVKDGQNYIHGLIEPGDNILIQYNAADFRNSLSFSGKGREKCVFLNSFYSDRISFMDKKNYKERVLTAKNQKYPFDYLLNVVDSVENKYFQKLDSIKTFLSRESFVCLKAQVKSAFLSSRYHAITDVYSESLDETLEKRKNELTSRTKQDIEGLLKFDDSFYASTAYAEAVYNILFVHYAALQMTNKKSEKLLDKYDYLNKHLTKNLKIPVLTLFLDSDIGILNQAEDIEAVIKKTYLLPKDSLYRNFIVQKFIEVTTFKKGKPAPDFRVENLKGEVVSLASFKGKVIYLDFWYAACSPCHALFQKLKPAKEYFKDNENVVFLNVSIDKKDVWEKALTRFNIEGYHAFTQNKEGEHDIVKSYKVAGYPTTCLIDKNGNIFAATPSSNPDEFIKQIKDALKEDK